MTAVYLTETVASVNAGDEIFILKTNTARKLSAAHSSSTHNKTHKKRTSANQTTVLHTCGNAKDSNAVIDGYFGL